MIWGTQYWCQSQRLLLLRKKSVSKTTQIPLKEAQSRKTLARNSSWLVSSIKLRLWIHSWQSLSLRILMHRQKTIVMTRYKTMCRKVNLKNKLVANRVMISSSKWDSTIRKKIKTLAKFLKLIQMKMKTKRKLKKDLNNPQMTLKEAQMVTNLLSPQTHL